jgi:hypothetical protein
VKSLTLMPSKSSPHLDLLNWVNYQCRTMIIWELAIEGLVNRYPYDAQNWPSVVHLAQDRVFSNGSILAYFGIEWRRIIRRNAPVTSDTEI